MRADDLWYSMYVGWDERWFSVTVLPGESGKVACVACGGLLEGHTHSGNFDHYALKLLLRLVESSERRAVCAEKMVAQQAATQKDLNDRMLETFVKQAGLLDQRLRVVENAVPVMADVASQLAVLETRLDVMMRDLKSSTDFKLHGHNEILVGKFDLIERRLVSLEYRNGPPPRL